MTEHEETPKKTHARSFGQARAAKLSPTERKALQHRPLKRGGNKTSRCCRLPQQYL